MVARHVPRQGHSRSTHGRIVRPSHSHAAYDVPIVANLEYYEQVQVDLGEQITQAAIAPGAIGSGLIQDGIIQDLTPFADNIRPVVIVDSLPTLPDTDYPEGSLVVLTTDGKIYRNVADAWTAAVATVDLDAQITGTQIEDDAITTPKLAAGAVTASKIEANTITASEIAANTITAGQIATGAISADEIAAGAITTEKLGLVDEGGVTLLSAAGFGPTWRRFIQSGLYNSDFYSPPPIPGQVLTGSNELPYWTYDQVSGTKITAQSITDATVPSGRVIRFVMATAGAAGDRTQLVQYVAISGSVSRQSNYQINATFMATSDGLGEMFLEVAPVNAALSVVGDGTTFDSVTLTEINAEPTNVLTVNFTDNGQKPTPPDAAFLRVAVGMRRGSAGVNDTGTGYLAEVTIDRMISEIRVPDQSDSTKIGGQIVDADGVLSIRSQYGGGTAAVIDLDGDTGSISITGSLLGESGKRIDPSGAQPLAHPLHHSGSLAYATALDLAIVSGGNGGARAVPLVVTAPMTALNWIIWSTDTSLLRTAEIRLYRDNGDATLDFVTGSDGSFSFTPSAASQRFASLSGSPSLAPGVYWAVIRNTSTARTFGVGFTAAAGSLDLESNESNAAQAALGSTIDLSSWTPSSAHIGIFIGGTVWGVHSWDFI